MSLSLSFSVSVSVSASVCTYTRVCAGVSASQGKVDGEGVSARFDEPWALAVDECGRLLVLPGSLFSCYLSHLI